MSASLLTSVSMTARDNSARLESLVNAALSESIFHEISFISRFLSSLFPLFYQKKCSQANLVSL